MRLSISLVVAAASLVNHAVASTPVQPRGDIRSTPILKDYPGQGSLPNLTDIIKANGTTKDFLPLDNIQGDIFVGMKKPNETFVFFYINNATVFKKVLRDQVISLITSTQTLLSPPVNQPLALLNIGFSQTGLKTLGITDNLGDTLFSKGQFADGPSLGDVVKDWEAPWRGTNIHGVFLVGSDKQVFIDSLIANLLAWFGTSIKVIVRVDGAARPGAAAGREHFGYFDGISSPAITGFATTLLPGQALIPNGVILTGRPGDTGPTRPAWMLDGSFMVFRKLQQLVPEFDAYLTANAVQNAAGSLTTAEGAELLGARMIGRWKSGAPIDLTPDHDDPVLGADANQNNNFDYDHPPASLSTDQSRCPFSAHIRKTRPRADQPGNLLNQAIRGGIPYGPEVTADEAKARTTKLDRGLAFVEYQSVITNGFKFQQVSWMNNPNFPTGKTPAPGLDPIVGQAGNHAQRVVGGLVPLDFTKKLSIPEFVKPLGGEYFFHPSISALKTKIAA